MYKEETKDGIIVVTIMIIVISIIVWRMDSLYQNNDERIIEFKKCEEAGMEAILSDSGNIYCKPFNNKDE